MLHTKVVIGEKEVLIFYESMYQEYSSQAIETITKHLNNVQVKEVFDNLGLVHTTNKEVTLFSLNGEMETLLMT
ncbi:hypothetical protein [Paenibacillus qinlingensis]|uniref:Uncharacterized protein n=1 Tax=Paenibacillus qinlingensis TaxID=1837343 RepID=A0ABU1P7C9_9BACL|nr:hypothetical protein [Paenibacillus qinlingensis]MDR6555231.1 hypothetical protein [Paenibacillus qinlingensis]